jgi:hypothetical protein
LLLLALLPALLLALQLSWDLPVLAIYSCFPLLLSALLLLLQGTGASTPCLPTARGSSAPSCWRLGTCTLLLQPLVNQVVDHRLNLLQLV